MCGSSHIAYVFHLDSCPVAISSSSSFTQEKMNTRPLNSWHHSQLCCCLLIMYCGHTSATNCVGQRFPLQKPSTSRCTAKRCCDLSGPASAASGGSQYIRHSPHLALGILLILFPFRVLVTGRLLNEVQGQREGASLWKEFTEECSQTIHVLQGGCHYRSPLPRMLHFMRAWEKTWTALYLSEGWQ